MDLTEFDTKLKKRLAGQGDGKLPMNLSFDEPVEASAPADAVKVDVKQLMMGLGSLFAGGLGEEDAAGATDDPFGGGGSLDESFAGLE